MSKLKEIFDTKRKEVAEAKIQVPLYDLKAQAADQPVPFGFERALRMRSSSGGLALIAEVKRASPSQGTIREDFDAAKIAQTYAEAGATVLSVLTDFTFFRGHPEYLGVAKAASGLPCLRKDFIEDPYQVYQARAWGADAILLIVAALSSGQIQDLKLLASELNMDTLVEVHTEEEAETAIDAGASMIGVNNRDLSNFQISLDNSRKILPMLPKDALKVSESGLETKEDLDQVQSWGADAVLIGTTFCSSPDIGAKVHEVMGWR